MMNSASNSKELKFSPELFQMDSSRKDTDDSKDKNSKEIVFDPSLFVMDVGEISVAKHDFSTRLREEEDKPILQVPSKKRSLEEVMRLAGIKTKKFNHKKLPGHYRYCCDSIENHSTAEVFAMIDKVDFSAGELPEDFELHCLLDPEDMPSNSPTVEGGQDISGKYDAARACSSNLFSNVVGSTESMKKQNSISENVSTFENREHLGAHPASGRDSGNPDFSNRYLEAAVDAGNLCSVSPNSDVINEGPIFGYNDDQLFGVIGKNNSEVRPIDRNPLYVERGNYKTNNPLQRMCGPAGYMAKPSPSSHSSSNLQSRPSLGMKRLGMGRKFSTGDKSSATSLSSTNICDSKIGTTKIGVPSGIRYFNVMWGKISTRKHKKWDGDAVIEVTARSVVLKDLDGHMLGQGSGYKANELTSLEDGSTLVVGGKLIEIQDLLDHIPEAFRSNGNKENKAEVKAPSTAEVLGRSAVKRPLSGIQNISLKKPKFGHQYKQYDKDHLDAIILPRPSEDQIMDSTDVKDVIVEPFLGSKLRPHQKEGVAFLYKCVMGMSNQWSGGILADEMGLGKTLQTITLIWTLLKQNPFGRNPILKNILIVSPCSLIKNWSEEFNKWLGSHRLMVFTLDQNNKPLDFQKYSACPVMILSYEILVRHASDVASIDFDLIVCDEGHRLKNAKSKINDALMQLPCERRILLTGTPVQNELSELYSLVNFVCPGLFHSLSVFKDKYEGPILAAREPGAHPVQVELGLDAEAELNEILESCILRRTTTDTIKRCLPPRVENVIICKMSPLQAALYPELIESHAVQSCFESGSGRHSVFANICALKKLCNHPRLLAEDDILLQLGYTSRSFGEAFYNIEASGKIKVLKKVLGQFIEKKEKVVLVSHWTKTLDILAEACCSLGLKCARLDGSTAANERQRMVNAFNATGSDYDVFLLSAKAGGLGLNLTAASRLIMFDVDWNPATDVQAMARIYREGQKKPIHVYRLLLVGTIEEKIFQRQLSKLGLSGSIVDQILPSTMPKFTRDQLKDLFTIDTWTDSIIHNQLDCACNGDGSNATAKPESCTAGLASWVHLKGPVPAEAVVDDPCLAVAGDNVTFLFRSRDSINDENSN